MAERVGVLVVEAGVHPGREYVIPEGRKFYIGRDASNDYGVPTATNVSRVHCCVENKGGTLSITDLDSKNGTFVNGKRTKSRALRHNDLIQVGGIRLRVRIPSAEEPRPPAGPEGPLLRVRKPSTEADQGAAAELVLGARRVVDEATSLAGQTVGGCHLMNVVGASRRGVVFKAVQPDKNRLVAVKVLTQTMAETPAGLRWFIEGARRAGALRHEDLVPVLGGGRHEKFYYVITLFMARGSAAARFRHASSGGVASVRAALQSLVHAARALEYGLKNGVLHGGVRPSKILYDEKRRPRLNGLGFENGPGPGFEMDSPAARYLAPEQVARGAAVDFRADIYGLGATFYYMLTGRPPQRDARGALISPRQANRFVPESLCRIVERMVETDPERRYSQYGELLHDLRWALRGEVWPAGR